MTEEQIALLTEILEQKKAVETGGLVLSIITIAFIIAWVAIDLWLYKKKRQMRNEWLSTLTPEQVKAVKESSKFKL